MLHLTTCPMGTPVATALNTAAVRMCVQHLFESLLYT